MADNKNINIQTLSLLHLLILLIRLCIGRFIIIIFIYYRPYTYGTGGCPEIFFAEKELISFTKLVFFFFVNTVLKS